MYLTELYALAMGFSPDELGLKFHRTRLTGILEKLGIQKKIQYKNFQFSFYFFVC